MSSQMPEAVVIGNVALDVLCYPVDDVPRHDSISFERSSIGPGGCGSNVAIGLSALGVPVALIARLGDDLAGGFLRAAWDRAGLDHCQAIQIPGEQTGTSVGLVDSRFQPRFIHATGANRLLAVKELENEALIGEGIRAMHIARYFVLPGLLDPALSGTLKKVQECGIFTSLDVVQSPQMSYPAPLWPCLPFLDLFMCNAQEAEQMLGEPDPVGAARLLREKGARSVVIKLGARGVWLDSESFTGIIPAWDVPVLDTTGAGDAFAAGMIAGLLAGDDLKAACNRGNEAGSRIVRKLGAVTAWLE